MAKHHVYVLSGSFCLKKPCPIADLREFLEEEYCVNKIEVIHAPISNDRTEFSIQLQLTFEEPQMEENEPKEDVVSEIDRELRAYLKTKYMVESLDLLGDSPTSFLLAVEEDPDE